MAEVLVVTSKVKKFIKEAHGHNTSGETIEALSKRVEEICNAASEKAKSEGRKTVMARDVE